MKIRKFICVLFSLAFIFSCSDENLPSDNLSNGEHLSKIQNTNNRVDIGEAMSIADEAIAFLDKEHPSESRSSRRVNSVSVLLFGDIKSSILKSGEYGNTEISDTLAYVFNFEDSLGYAIISNDTRIDNPLLAFTKKGSLFNGKTNNPGLIVFLERLRGYVLKSIIESNKTEEQKLKIATKGGPVSPSPLFINVRPLVPVEWGQGKPFWLNLNAPQCPNGYYVTGCVATATAQIMSRWMYPTTIGNMNYSWTLLNKYRRSNDFYPYSTDSPSEIAEKATARAMVADLFQRIGTGVSMNYGCDGSGSHASLGIAFLVSNGLTLYGNTYLRDYNFGFAEAVLESRRPLMARGCNVNAGGGCHAWVIDGLASRFSFINNDYLHNNWGWDGVDNGYYVRNVFDPLDFNFKNIEIGLVYR